MFHFIVENRNGNLVHSLLTPATLKEMFYFKKFVRDKKKEEEK